MCFSLSTPIPLIFINATFLVTPANCSWTQIIWPKRITQQSNQAWTDTLSFPFIFDGVKLSLISSPFIGKVWQTIVETWRYIPVSHLRYDLGGIWTSPRTRSRDSITDQRSFHWQDKQTWRNVQHKWNDQRESNLLDQTRGNGFNFFLSYPRSKGKC